MNTHESWTSWVESGEWAESSDTAMPVLPAIAGDVMGLAMDPEVSIARIARCFTSHLQTDVYGTQGRDLMDHAIGTAYLAPLLAERLGTVA